MNTPIIARLQLNMTTFSFAELASCISTVGGDIVSIDSIELTGETAVRDVTIAVATDAQRDLLADLLPRVSGVTDVHFSNRTFRLHDGGKIGTSVKAPILTNDDLAHVYTPGVAHVCTAIAERPEKAYALTIKRNTVAVVSDGSAVLGLGNIGPAAAMPVMEGKAMLFKQLADVDSFPLCLDTQNTEEIIQTIKAIAPAFGGINLEDIAAPRCFEIERRLKEELDIPVFHDDQHGTAVVLLAGLLNALRVTKKNIADIKVVLTGVGAAGMACTNILLSAGVTNIIGVDRFGAIHRGTTYDNPHWNDYAARTNPDNLSGALSDVIAGADVFIGVSAPGLLTVEHLQSMNVDPIVFAMANPTPEIDPALAAPYVRVMATGRSDYPNQINNVLCFPGMFRGALDCGASDINEAMKVAAAKAIASVVTDEQLSETYIIPSVFHEDVVDRVRTAVMEAAYETGVARQEVIEVGA